jgi:predicted nucleic acid-binding protein
VGSVNLPLSGRVYVDTQIVVYTVDRHPQFASILDPLWHAVRSSSLTVLTSELTTMEVLVHPLRHNQPKLVSTFEEFMRQPGLTLVPVSRTILRRGAMLRASMIRLRTPDAIHVAIALELNCDCVLTNDAGWRGVQVPTVVLSDVGQPL